MTFIYNFLNKIYQERKFLLLSVFFASLFFSIVFLFFFSKAGPAQHQETGTDYKIYYEPIANNILEGKGFIFREGVVVGGVPIGYPLILAGILYLSQLIEIEKLWLITVFNVLISALAPIFLFLLAQEIFNKRIGLISAFLWMTYPFNLWFFKNPNTEVPFIALFFLAIWILVLAFKRHSLKLMFLAGIFLGMSSSIRYISLFISVPIFFFILFYFSKDKSKKIAFLMALILLAGQLTIVLPWDFYLLIKDGHHIPFSSINSGGFVNGFVFAWRPGAGGDKAKYSSDIADLMEKTRKTELKNISEVIRFSFKELVLNPITFLKLMLIKTERAWYATSQMWWEGKILLIQSFYLFLALIGLAFWLKIYREKIKYLFFLLIIIFYFWGTTVIALSIMRYMVPAMGMVIIFSAVAINEIGRKLNLNLKNKFVK